MRRAVGRPRCSGPRYGYGPASEAWRLNREAMLLLGAGPRALLLQLAHPAVAAGVAEHSDFRTDPWRRLGGHAAELPDDRLRHDRRGRRRDPAAERTPRGIAGAGYRPAIRALAVGPRHAGRVDHRGLRRVARAAVPADRRAAFYAETRPIGRAFGVPDALLPTDLDASKRTSRRCSARPVRSASGPSRARLAGSCSGHRSLRSRRCCRVRRGDRLGAQSCPAGGLRLDALAIGRAAAGERSARTTACAGGLRERALSAWLVAGWRAGGRCSPPASGDASAPSPRTGG